MAVIPLGIASFLMEKTFLLALPVLSLRPDGRATPLIEGTQERCDA